MKKIYIFPSFKTRSKLGAGFESLEKFKKIFIKISTYLNVFRR